MSDTGTRIALGSPLAPGVQLNDTYEIDARIASGGMGEVYRGHNIETGEPVAIKTILPELAHQEAIVALFRKEATILGRLHHDAIVRYLSFSRDPRLDRRYLAMEFVDGISLADRLAERPLGVDEVRLLFTRVAEGLALAHDAGVIHRDLSPDNIILVGGDTASPKLIDFGIARSANTGEGTLIGGGFAGKYNFVSPEQLGIHNRAVERHSDIYSLGLVIAACLRGRPLDMGGSHAEVIEKRNTVPDLSDIDPELRPLLETMLEPDPAKRPADAMTIAEWLRTPAGQRPITVPPVATDASTDSDGPPRPQAPPGDPIQAPNGTSADAERLRSVPFSFSPPNGTAGSEARSEPPKPSLGRKVRAFGLLGLLVLAVGGAAYLLSSRPQTPVHPPDVNVPPPKPPEVDDPAQRYRKLVDFIRAYPDRDCLIALPAVIGDRAAALKAFAGDKARLDAFRGAMPSAGNLRVDISEYAVGERQCPALSFIRGASHYPEFSLLIQLDGAEMASGASLSGSVLEAGQRELHLLLVDDEGRVQSIDAYLSAANGAERHFHVPLTLTGGKPVGTEQMLLAIASDVPLPELAAVNGPAAGFFEGFAAKLRTVNAGVDLALEGFRLR